MKKGHKMYSIPGGSIHVDKNIIHYFNNMGIQTIRADKKS